MFTSNEEEKKPGNSLNLSLLFCVLLVKSKNQIQIMYSGGESIWRGMPKSPNNITLSKPFDVEIVVGLFCIQAWILEPKQSQNHRSSRKGFCTMSEINLWSKTTDILNGYRKKFENLKSPKLCWFVLNGRRGKWNPITEFLLVFSLLHRWFAFLPALQEAMVIIGRFALNQPTSRPDCNNNKPKERERVSIIKSKLLLIFFDSC